MKSKLRARLKIRYNELKGIKMQDIKVLLVEDHTMTRMGISLALQQAEGISLVGEAEDGQKGVRLAKELLPDVILMDIGLPVMDGIEATRLIREANLNSKILMFTSRDDEKDVFASLSSGADGYVMKGITPEQLSNAIKAVNDGAAWLDPAIAKMVLANVQNQSRQPIKSNTDIAKINSYGLTDRELDVLALIVDGLTNVEIAEKLVIAKPTAKAHVHNILQKLYAANRTQATITALKEGLV